MTDIRARYYDGRSARAQEVTLRFDATGHLEILGDERRPRYPLQALKISARVGDTPRSIAFPDGGKCETVDNDAVDAVLAARGEQPYARLMHRLESVWPYIALLFVLTLGVVWGIVNYGVPEIARRAAFSMPVSADRALARNTLKVLDGHIFAPSEIDTERQRALKTQFDDMVRSVDSRYRFRLAMRSSAVAGANAFALPDGTIVVTDALVDLAQRDEELLAVLAHEIGHVVHRHALRGILQNSAVALLVAFALGDVLSVTSLAAALPTLMVEAKFSRDFEREADQYALEFLRARRIPLHHGSAILKRLAARGGNLPTGLEYLSSHPGIEERSRRFTEAR